MLLGAGVKFAVKLSFHSKRQRPAESVRDIMGNATIVQTRGIRSAHLVVSAVNGEYALISAIVAFEVSGMSQMACVIRHTTAPLLRRSSVSEDIIAIAFEIETHFKVIPLGALSISLSALIIEALTTRRLS